MGKAAIETEGLNEFRSALDSVDMPKMKRQAEIEAGNLVIAWAKPRVPVRSGRAVRSLMVKPVRNGVRVSGGGTQAEYFPWLDFGGDVGRNHATHRARVRRGRYIYKGYDENLAAIGSIMQKALKSAFESEGIEVSSG